MFQGRGKGKLSTWMRQGESVDLLTWSKVPDLQRKDCLRGHVGEKLIDTNLTCKSLGIVETYWIEPLEVRYRRLPENIC